MNNSKAKIVHITTVHKAIDPRIFEKECASLAAAGYDVTLIATGEAPSGTSFNVVARPPSRHRLLRMTIRPLWALFTAMRLRPDVVHLHDPELIPWGVLFRLFRVKVVFDSHEDIPATMKHKSYLGAVQRRVAAFLGRGLVLLADRSSNGIVAATPSIAAAYQNLNKCTVQNFPILADWTFKQGRPTAANLAYIGGISAPRGVWPMMDALEKLARSHGARLLLAGPIAEDLLESLKLHPAWGAVDYRGVLPRADVAALLADCVLGVVLFQPLPNHINSQPTKMFEYMASGLPVLASDYPLWRRFLVDTGSGVVADPTDVDAIVEQASRILDDPPLGREMGIRGRELVETEQNWGNEGRTLVAFYERLTGVSS